MSETSEIKLPSPTKGTEGWHFFVPSAFARSIDRLLKSSADTPITNSVFACGDTFYDSRDGYLPWNQALKHIRRAITVEGDTAGMVTFRIHHVRNGRLQGEDVSRKLP